MTTDPSDKTRFDDEPVDPFVADDETLELLIAYVDGELAAADVERAERLLSESPAARERTRQYRLVGQELTNLRVRDEIAGHRAAPDSTLAAVRRRLEDAPAASRSRAWKLSAFFAAAAALVLVASLAAHFMKDDGQPSTDLASVQDPDDSSLSVAPDFLESLDVLEDLHAEAGDIDAELADILLEALEYDAPSSGSSAEDGVPLTPDLLQTWLPEELVGETP